MPQLRASVHYIWSEADVLGRGATGEVYKARNKATGEVFAVKTFNHMGIMRPVDIQRRELDVLCKLEHKNIVQLLTIEEDVSLRTKVIVMELCTGGSLYGILDEPQNAYGLQEEEFLTVLFDVAAGMEYLRSRDIVHRDIKPGNIMKCLTDDGRSVYKLTDFGAARELVDEEPFMSLYGTEEYLHPDMYERAVMNINLGKKFEATVDLWSLGVTFYHVATGLLPFRPLGGRKNREMMYKITQEKDSGVISGVQETELGDIKWSRVLPQTCRLSLGLKNLITPMLASLLENDKMKMWGFERFFEEVRNLKEKVVVVVFHVCLTRILKIYLDPHASLSQLQEMIAEQTDVRASQQLLLFENAYFSDTVTPLQFVNTYPQTTAENPVFLFPKQAVECSPIDEPQVDKLPSLDSSLSVENDAAVSRHCCGVLHSVDDHVQRNFLCRRLISKACKLLTQVFTFEVNNLRECVEHLYLLTVEIGKRVQSLHSNHSLCVKWYTVLSEKHTVICEPPAQVMTDVQQKHAEMVSDVGKTKESVEKISDEKERMSTTFIGNVIDEENKRKGQIIILLQNVTEITELFKKDRLHRRLTYNEEQIHKFEKMRLQSVCVQAWSVYEHSNHQMELLRDQLMEWLSGILKLMERHRELDEEVLQAENQLQRFSTYLDEAGSEYTAWEKDTLSSFQKQTTKQQTIPRSKASNHKDKKKQLLQSLQADLALLTTDTVQIRRAMEENQQVLNTIKLMNELEADGEDGEFEVIHMENSSASPRKENTE